MTGVILSGGKSLRMGEDKAFIKIEGMPIVERILPVTWRVYFRKSSSLPIRKERYPSIRRVKVYDDLIPNLGALGGLYTAIARASFPYSFVVACDMPFLRRDVIEYLTEKTG